MLPPKKFFLSLAHRLVAMGRNMLQWPPDNHNNALLVSDALINFQYSEAIHLANMATAN